MSQFSCTCYGGFVSFFRTSGCILAHFRYYVLWQKGTTTAWSSIGMYMDLLQPCRCLSFSPPHLLWSPRVVPGFLVQTGDKTGTGNGGESFYGGTSLKHWLESWLVNISIEPFEDEVHPRLRFSHRGLVGMANNGQKNSNDSQFFITLGRPNRSFMLPIIIISHSFDRQSRWVAWKTYIVWEMYGRHCIQWEI